MVKKKLPQKNVGHEKIASKVVEKIESFEHQFRDKMIVLVVSAFGIVAAFTWNDLIREIVAEFVPQDDVLVWRVFAAVLVTVIAVVVTVILSAMKPKKRGK